jgi:hypothetical protein
LAGKWGDRSYGGLYSQYLKDQGVYTGSGYEEYETKLAAPGTTYNSLVYAESTTVIVALAVSGFVFAESWTNFVDSSKGYFSVDGVTTAAAGSDDYGCTGKTLSTLQAEDSHLTDSEGEGMGQMFCEKTTNNAIGGYFFSKVLGGYDSFVAHISNSILCGSDVGLKTFTSAYGVWYLYFLHGWGESSWILFEYEPIISFIKSSLTAVSNMVTIVVDDTACPYGGKTWYVNTVFTGYHMDLICFDMPEFLEKSLGLGSLGKGIFGFSMGGFGAINIVVTYPTLFLSAALFNAVLDADSCMWYGYCHTYCGVDSLLCDIKWTTPHVAFTPYVVMSPGSPLSSTGSYDPVNYGIAVEYMDNGNDASCFSSYSIGSGSLTGSITDEGAVISTVTARAGLTNMAMKNGKVDFGYFEATAYALEGATAESGSMFASIPFTTFTPYSTSSAYYYLDPVVYTQATQSFDPTFNPVTEAEITATWDKFIEVQPIHRLMFDNSLSYSAMVIFVSCDSDDPYGLVDQANQFTDMYAETGSTYSVKSGTGIVGETAYAAGCGHCMSLRDFYVAYLWFADVFDTWTTCGMTGTWTHCFSGGAYSSTRHLSAPEFARTHSSMSLDTSAKTTSYMTTANLETSTLTTLGITVSSSGDFPKVSSFFSSSSSGWDGDMDEVVKAFEAKTTGACETESPTASEGGDDDGGGFSHRHLLADEEYGCEADSVMVDVASKNTAKKQYRK